MPRLRKVRFCERARDRFRHREQPLRREGRTRRCGRLPCGYDDAGSGSGCGKARNRRASSATSLNSTRPQLSRMTSSRSPCSPVAASVHLPAAPLPDSGPSRRTNIERPGRVANVAHHPVAAFAPPAGEVFPAHGLGLPAETMCEVGCVAGHHAASRSAMRSIGNRSSSLARIAGPEVSVGTNSRNFQEMISPNRP